MKKYACFNLKMVLEILYHETYFEFQSESKKTVTPFEQVSQQSDFRVG